MEKKLYKIGELSKKTGKTHRALRLYEEKGLLVPDKRTQSKYRLYSEDALVQIRWIEGLQSLGFSLPEIQRFVDDLRIQSKGVDLMNALRMFYVTKQQEIDQKIEQLMSLRGELKRTLLFLSICSGCKSDADLSGCLNCNKHGDVAMVRKPLNSLNLYEKDSRYQRSRDKTSQKQPERLSSSALQHEGLPSELFPELIQAPLRVIN